MINKLKIYFTQNKNAYIAIKLIFVVIFVFSLNQNIVYSQEFGNNPGGSGSGSSQGQGTGTGSDITLDFQLKNPLAGSGVNTITDFVKRLLDIVLTIGVPIIAVFIILAGFQFVTARGNPAKIDKAKENLFGVMIGAAILLGAWVLANALGETVNELVTP